MPGWWQRITGRSNSGSSRADPAIYAEMRAMALAIDPEALDLPADRPWGGAAIAVMELGLGDGSATVVAVADGTVSLYLSSGGGTIGAGDHAAVAAPAQRFRELMAQSRGLLTAVDAFPAPPADGQVGFHARVGETRYTATVPESAVRAGRHPLAELYAAGQDVLTEIRLASD